ncbi:cell division protein FtsQ/DivIB [Commensalibacter nepenthis]|uniref:Cell division protein FtsQ n=1 Tax=Commensalibacter nepenthis TaxID=3043872 RepID=A0ABT6Q6J4_9PROT|nr:cell division protein FtsQ/DivIB [Commensalibacter sp. TBRC 10068]MDI2112511.1 cell division protein FtsQ/DivIB [Commensalibacter sp. TBRC 10068]
MSYLKKRPEYQNDRPSKSKIAILRSKRLLRPFILLLLIIGFFIGGGWLVFKMAGDEHFSVIEEKIGNILPMKITKILITGCNLTSEQDVKDALGIQIGDSIFNFSVQDAQKRLNDLPFADHVLLKRQLPNTIIIHITERTPFAVWQFNHQFKLIDRKGEIVNDHGMSGKDGKAFLQLPLVVGYGANTSASELVDILSSQPEIKKHVVAAVRVGNRRWNLDLKNHAVVLLPENQELPAIQRLNRLQKEMQILDRPIKTIDLRLADRLIIQEDKSFLNKPKDTDNPDNPDNADHSDNASTPSSEH